MMKRFLLTTAIALAAFGASGGDPVARFDLKLSPEQKIQQAVSRLTFGARPGPPSAQREPAGQGWPGSIVGRWLASSW